jgi:hypothetical protein
VLTVQLLKHIIGVFGSLFLFPFSVSFSKTCTPHVTHSLLFPLLRLFCNIIFSCRSHQNHPCGKNMNKMQPKILFSLTAFQAHKRGSASIDSVLGQRCTERIVMCDGVECKVAMSHLCHVWGHTQPMGGYFSVVTKKSHTENTIHERDWNRRMQCMGLGDLCWTCLTVSMKSSPNSQAIHSVTVIGAPCMSLIKAKNVSTLVPVQNWPKCLSWGGILYNHQTPLFDSILSWKTL